MNELRLTEEEIDFAVALADQRGVVFLLDHLGLDGLGNRVNDEKKQLLEQLRAYEQAVERLRLKVLERPADTEERNTYADGFTSGLREALQMTRVDIAGLYSTCEHEWVDATNEVVESGEICVKCHAMRAAPWSSHFEFESQKKPAV